MAVRRRAFWKLEGMEPTKSMLDRKNRLGPTVAIGAAAGALIGVIFHHLALWMAVGCAVGTLIGVLLARFQRH